MNLHIHLHRYKSWLIIIGMLCAGIICCWFAVILAQPNSPAASAPTGSSAVNETPVTDDAKNNYTVANNRPQILTIPKLNIKTRIYGVGNTANNAIATPALLDDVGWYKASALPGRSGVTFINGHNQGKNRPGVFANLGSLKIGQRITIERGDGVILTYIVDDVMSQPVANIDMQQLLMPTTVDEQTLVLMTCGGVYDRSEAQYDERVIVHARLY